MTSTRSPASSRFPLFPTLAETPSVLHYTSGTTGQPKGAQHVHGSLLAQYLTAKWVLDLQPDDVYWCNADPGWVTGTSYGIIGPWANGVTQVVLDVGLQRGALVLVHREAPGHGLVLGADGHPPPDARGDGAGPPARPLLAAPPRERRRAAQRRGGHLVREAFGKPFHDTYWQTETGSIVITNFPGMKIKPGSMGRPFPGHHGDGPRPEDVRAGRDDRARRPDRPHARLAVDDPRLLEQPGGLREEVRERLVPPRRPRPASTPTATSGSSAATTTSSTPAATSSGRSRSSRRCSSTRPSPSRPPSRSPTRSTWRSSRPSSRSSRASPQARDLELEIMNFIRKRLSPLAMPQEIEFVDIAAQDAERQDHAPGPPRAGVGRADRRPLHADGGLTMDDIRKTDPRLRPPRVPRGGGRSAAHRDDARSSRAASSTPSRWSR